MLRTSRGFTLLEVLVAIAILGLGLTVVLSAQSGVFYSYSRATRMSQAPGLLRCKMEELELELATKGYSLVDEEDEGECCEDTDADDYHCSWKIERVELPSILADDPLAGDAGVPDVTGAASESALGEEPALGEVQSGVGGPLSALSEISASNGAALGTDPTIGGLSSMMGGDSAGSGMASMVMGLVYPDLKPMLEASIRKITVSVHWREGKQDREFAVTQYVTNPMQGGFDPLTGAVVDELGDQLENAQAGQAGNGGGR